MKKLLTLLVFLCSLSTFAQDVIVKKDGSTVLCRVVELNTSQIIYKAWTDLNGDSRVMSRSDASAINYQDGKRVDLGEVSNLYTPGNQNDGVQKYNDAALLNMVYDYKALQKKAKTYRIIGIGGLGLICVGGILMLVANNAEYGYEYEEYRDIALPFLGVGVIGAATGFIVAHNYKKKAKQIQSISLYQQEFKFNNGSSISPSIDLLQDQALNHQTIGVGVHYNF